MQWRVAWATVLLTIALGAPAWAQNAYVADPTGGVQVPTTPLAGEHDVLTVTANPAGLALLRGWQLGLAYAYRDDEAAATTGSGWGGYLSGGIGGGLLPRLALGAAVELLRPPEQLRPEPGSPTRLTLSGALPLGSSLGLGAAWHRYWDGDGELLDGLSSWDLGLSLRVGARFAAGFVVRDVGSPVVDDVELGRRYLLELVSRPVATDRLEIGLGGEVGESRGDLGGWLRISARVRRGVYVRGELGVRETELAGADRDGQVFRASLGLEVSFGSIGVFGFGSGAAHRETGDDGVQFAGAGGSIRLSTEQVPSALGPRQRVERIELSGSLGARGLTSHVLRLRALARDEGVAGVLLVINGLGVGWAGLQELRGELARLRTAGKKVFAYLVAASTGEYFLAAAADRVYLDPAGGIRLQGFAGTILYFKGLFDQLGVSAEFEKIAEYKSAPETFTQIGPSEPALRMRSELYDSLYAELIGGLARSRGLAPAVVTELINNGPYTAGDLQNDERLVNAVASPEELPKLIAAELGAAYPIAPAPAERLDSWALPKVAVIFIEGDIVDGESRNVPLPLPFIGGQMVGGDTITRAIAQARLDPAVEAIVLRIDSPGGSALASELIAREVFKTRGVKPILCSMGEVAASGGYYAAAGCDTIFADPMTITGSIGIFYGKFDLSGLLAKLGITWNTYRRGERADMESWFRPYSEDERKLILEKMRYLYELFLERVAQGRGISEKRADELGRGRVYSGEQAKALELVDRLGGIGEAIAMAKAQAGLEEGELAQLVYLPETRQSVLGQLLGLPELQSEANAAALELLAPLARTLREVLPLSVLMQPTVPQARLPFAISWP